MPGLLTLQTDLKSLKYGQDRPNGGSSGQPYIQTDIRTVDATFSRDNLTLYDDGLIRGGMVASQNASLIDTKRIAKFLADPPKGPLFLTRQVGLQLSNPQLEKKGDTTERYVGPSRIYNLGINTITQVPLIALGEHIVRHGLLPVSNKDEYYEAVVTSNNFQNDGRNNRLLKYADKFLLGGLGDSVRNPYVGSWDSSTELNKYVGGPGSTYGIGNTLLLRYSNTNEKNKIKEARLRSKDHAGKVTNDEGEIEDLKIQKQFLGASAKQKSTLAPDYGPLSNVIDKPLENRIYSPDDKKQTYANISRKTGDVPRIKNTVDFGISKESGSKFNGGKKFNLIDFGGSNNNTINDNSPLFFFVASDNDKNQIHAGVSRETGDVPRIKSTADYGLSNKSESLLSDRDFNDLPTQITSNDPLSFYYAKSTDPNAIHTRNSNLPAIDNSNDTTTNGPSSYPNTDISSLTNQLNLPNLSFNYTNPNVKTYTTVKTKIDKTVSKGIKNSGGKTLNHTPVGNYVYNAGTKVIFNRKNDRSISKDTLALSFKAIRAFDGTEEKLDFLAYLTDYQDSFDSGWNDVKYVGRAEKFYIFNEFKREISLGFNIPCFNRRELTDKHKKLNQLVSILAGEYNPSGLLGGIITRLTVGNYLNDQPGVIKNMSFQPIDESSWDLKAKLAFYIKVSFGFTVIHQGLPQYGYDFITVPDIPPAAEDDGNTGQALPKMVGDVIVGTSTKTDEGRTFDVLAGQRGPNGEFVF